MAIELKLIFEGLDKVKQKIEEGFKTGINIGGKGGKAPEPNFKYVGKPIVDLNNKIKTFAKSMSLNNSTLNKLNSQISNLQKIQSKIMPGSPGSTGRMTKLNDLIERNQGKILKLTDKNNKINLSQSAAIDAMLEIEGKNPIGEQTINTLSQQIKVLEDIRNNLSSIEEINKINNNIQNKQNKLGELTGGGKGAKGGKGMAGMAILMGGMIGLMMQLVQSTKSIQFVMEFIGGLLNMLIGPLIPILLTLLKPFLMIFMILSQFMFTFFKDPGKAFKDLFDMFILKFEKAYIVNSFRLINALLLGLEFMVNAIIFGFNGLIKLINFVLPKSMEISELNYIELPRYQLNMIEKAYEDFSTNMINGAKEGNLTATDAFKYSKTFLLGIKNSFIKNSKYEEITNAAIENGIDTMSLTGALLQEGSKNMDIVWITAIQDMINTGKMLSKKSTSLAKSLGFKYESKYLKQSLASPILDEKKITSNPFIEILNGLSNPTKIGDGVISPNGKLISTSPQDYLIATKNPGNLNNGNTFNIKIEVKSDMNGSTINKLTKELRRTLSAKGAF